jgi:hypothetical protein
MTGLVSVGFALLGVWSVWFGAREWRRREAETQADDAFFGAGRGRHSANWLRPRSNAVAFVGLGIVLVALAGARLLAAA